MSDPKGAPSEFHDLPERAREAGLVFSDAPTVERRFAQLPDRRQLSVLCWGSATPEVVLLHGGAQNAHTWDTVALALDRPLVAIDLPGHGHSDWREDGDYSALALAVDVEFGLRELAPAATMLVGMGLGGAVGRRVAKLGCASLQVLALVDAGSGQASRTRAESTRAGETVKSFVSGDLRFGSFEEMLERTLRFNPGRSESSLRRGVWHNARELPDGSWTWRWDPAVRDIDHSRVEPSEPDRQGPPVPLLIIRGGQSDVLSEEGAAKLAREPGILGVVSIEGAGHGVQGDRPLELARALGEHLPS
jgi:pimeloyl-ACP methyl ester carboxylesterase